MSYISPIGIFSPAQIETLSVDKLKSLKKETLLHFQLSDEATIERNGRHMDKNQVLEIFDVLQSDLDLHLKIYNNKPLLEFLEHQHMGFFSDSGSQQSVLNDAEHGEQINNILASELDAYTSSILNHVRFSSLGQLKLIAEYSLKMSAGLQDKAYAKSYREMKAFVDHARTTYTDPFASEQGLSMHPDLDKQVNPLLYRCFEFLPGPFRDIAFLYGVWCNNEIVVKAVNREKDFTKYKRIHLKTLSKAMEIAINVADSPGLRQNSNQVKEILKGKSTKQTATRKKPVTPSRDKKETKIELPKFNFKVILLVVLGIIAALMIASKFTGQNYTTTSDNQTQEKSKPLDTRNKRLETTKERSQDNTNSTRTSGAYIDKALIPYSGDDLEICQTFLKGTKDVDDMIELEYEVSTFPSNVKDFFPLIPNRILDQYRGYTKDFTVTFKHRDIPGIEFKHGFSAEMNDRNGNNKITYQGSKRNSARNSASLSSARLPRIKNMRGKLSKYKPGSKSPIISQAFIIAADNNATPPPRENTKPFTPDPEVLTEEIAEGDSQFLPKEKFDVWYKYKISGNLDQRYKDIILYNCNQIAYRSSRLMKTYRVPDMAVYRPFDGPSFGFDNEKIVGTQVLQRSFTQSSWDKVAIFNVGSKDVEMRVFISQETQQLLGMVMVLPGDGVVEVLEVFFE